MKQLIINTYPASWQAAMGIILKPILSTMGVTLNIGSLCEHLGVGRTSAYDAKQELDSRLFSMSPGQKSEQRINELENKLRSSQREIREKEFKVEYYRYIAVHPDCYVNGLNSTYTEAFKQFILGLKGKYGFTLSAISRLTCIPEDTLKKFRRVNDGLNPNEEVKELPENVIKLLNTYLQKGRGVKSVKKFYRKNPVLLKELQMSYRQVLSWLSRLGFVNPKGIFLKNTGLDRIIRFCPNAVRGSDGKHITVSINGFRFHWVWQSLADYKTTVIVGGLLSENETTDNLLEAIQASKEKTGIPPLALVLDNRLSENLPAIKAWLDEYGIEIIKTFPGNPKSSGIVEGNFNIFERWVGGRVTVHADNYESLSRDIAQMLVEVFTQMRNHQPRKGLGMKTPKEVMKEAEDKPPSKEAVESMKEKLKELADRFKREQSVPVIAEQKESAIKLAIEETNPKDEKRFREELSRSVYTHDLILQAIAVFKTRRQEYPEKNYDHTYFGGILRRLADNRSIEWLNTNLKDIYYHQFENLVKRNEKDLLASLNENQEQTLLSLASDYLKMPVPAWESMILLQMKELFYIASRGSRETAENLCEKISTVVVKWTFEAKKKRDVLLCRIYEWLNYVRIYGNA